MQLVQISKQQYLALMEAGAPAHAGDERGALLSYKDGKMDQHFQPWRALWEIWADESDQYWTCVE